MQPDAVVPRWCLQGFGFLVLLVFVCAASTVLTGRLSEGEDMTGRDLAMTLQAPPGTPLKPESTGLAAAAAQWCVIQD